NQGLDCAASWVSVRRGSVVPNTLPRRTLERNNGPADDRRPSGGAAVASVPTVPGTDQATREPLASSPCRVENQPRPENPMRKLASIQTVNAVEPIPNADAIEKVRVLGWWVVAKGRAQAGRPARLLRDRLAPARAAGVR